MALASATDAGEATARLQAEAWLAWLIAASLAVFLTDNPLYLATTCLIGLVVYASLPGGRRRRAYGLVVKIGLFFALLSIPFNVLTGSSGATSLMELPRLAFPGWLGGVTLGGNVTAEALLYAASRALRLVALLLFATAFNVGVDHYRLLRLVPAALRQLGVVITVSVLLLPQAFVQARAVSEAQRLRGRRVRGIRNAGAFVVPVLAGALERSIQRAESLDARGFGGRLDAEENDGVRVRLLTLVSIALAACGAVTYFYYRQSPMPALLVIAAGIVVALFILRARGKKAAVKRYSEEPLERSSALVIACSAASVALLLAMRLFQIGGISYFPYPAATVPAFHPLALMAVLLLLAPALCPAAPGRERAEDADD